MKKVLRFLPLFVVISLFNTTNTLAAVVKPTPVIPATIYNMPLKDFLTLTPKQISEISGKPMTMGQKIAYKLMRASMKKAVKKDPSITTGTFLSSSKKMKTWLLILIIVLGAFLLAFLIFALAYSGAI